MSLVELITVSLIGLLFLRVGTIEKRSSTPAGTTPLSVCFENLTTFSLLFRLSFVLHHPFMYSFGKHHINFCLLYVVLSRVSLLLVLVLLILLCCDCIACGLDAGGIRCVEVLVCLSSDDSTSKDIGMDIEWVARL